MFQFEASKKTSFLIELAMPISIGMIGFRKGTATSENSVDLTSQAIDDELRKLTRYLLVCYARLTF